ncbi:MAG: 50S ribosomal protein L1 [Verrucomicrobia bacterium]|nr:50S ribosomal protein L1 [Verrucomicrobiota bacterium]
MQRKESKRYKNGLKVANLEERYPLKKAVEILTKFPRAKFNETIDLSFHLGVDPKQSDQLVRGTVPLPHGSGRVIRVAVFTKAGPSFDAAVAAGAENVGFEDLIEKCKGGWVDFDVAIATPEAMVEVRKLGKVLGPRGLMPNPKTGTVTDDTGKAVKEFKAGHVEYKVDKTANINMPVGKISFNETQIFENVTTAISAIEKARPSAVRGTYIQSITLSTTMSPSVRIALKGGTAVLE